MATIRPFKAIRPTQPLAEKVAALPYDVMTSDEAREMVKGNEFSFLHVDKSEIDLPKGTDIYDASVYAKAKENLDNMRKQGTLIQDETPYLYVYELVMEGRAQTGLVVCTSIDEYVSGVIKKHELTREDKEQDRIRHVDTLNANTGPIFLTYRFQKSISDIIDGWKAENKAVYDFVSEDNVGHKVWVINDAATIEHLVQQFETVKNLYIADGHHRNASAVKVGLKRRADKPNFDKNEEFNFYLSVLFPDDQLKIMDYNRLVKDLNGLTNDQFLAKVAEKFTVETIEKARPKQPKQFSMYLDNQWYKLEVKPEFVPNDAVLSLDVSILQNNLLCPLLAIDDPRTNKRVDFVGGIRGLDELERRVNSGEMKVAFAMFETSMKELMDVADQDKIMPPKSTWFEPKLRSGLFIHELE